MLRRGNLRSRKSLPTLQTLERLLIRICRRFSNHPSIHSSNSTHDFENALPSDQYGHKFSDRHYRRKGWCHYFQLLLRESREALHHPRRCSSSRDAPGSGSCDSAWMRCVGCCFRVVRADRRRDHTRRYVRADLLLGARTDDLPGGRLRVIGLASL